MFDITRTIKCPIHNKIPVNTITNSIPNGLNHEGFGAVINPTPNSTDIIIVTRFTRRIYKNLILLDNIPTIITWTNKIVVTTKREASSPLRCCIVS